MDWQKIDLPDAVAEAGRIIEEAEIVLDFGADIRGWMRFSVFQDLRAGGYFARAQDLEDPRVKAIATADTPEAAFSACLREAGVSLRRARGK
ncbi:MAG: hypothetical protein VCC00_03110 [Deltaproteobacteria bacterium]